MPDLTLPNGRTIHQRNGRWYTQEMIELSNLHTLPNCPITFEIRKPCARLLELTQREHLVGTRHYDCDGTIDEFYEWVETKHARLVLGAATSLHDEFFINLTDGGLIEIKAGAAE